MRRVRLAVFSLLFLTGCSYINQLDEVSEDAAQEARKAVEVRFDVDKLHSLKSAVTPMEDAVVDLNLYVYSGGKLVDAEYYDDGIEPSVKLLYGQTYNLYVIANVGLVEAPVNEDEFRLKCHYAISGISDMADYIPMTWSMEGYQVRNLGERVSVRLERLAAKLLFSVDKSALRGLEINSVRLRQCSRIVWPFKNVNGSFAEGPDDVFDCDYASDSDLETLNDGGQVHFYMLENCQGQILSGNTDPWAKIPDNISSKSDVCTYLEVDCNFKDGFFYSGNVTYRLYLGQDSVSDFNVRRNTVLNASLYLTDDALARVSWRVEADVSVNEGYAGGWLSRGRHSIDDMYVGERFVYTVMLADEMMTHLNGNPKNARVCVLDSDNKLADVIRFSELEAVDSDGGGYRFEVEALCLEPACGTLGLQDINGKLLAVLDDFFVQKPLLRATESVPDGESMMVEPDVPLISFPINDDYYHFDLYLIDKEGCNLNTALGCGFDLSLFDLALEVDGLDDVLETLDFQITENEGVGRFARFYGRCLNDGDRDDLNDRLVGYVASEHIAELLFTEKNFGLNTNLMSCLDYMPLTLTLVDNGWAGYADCQLSMVVENPSKLPVRMHCWQLNRAKDVYNSTDRNEAVQLYGVDYTRERYDYVCGDYASNLLPMYCSGESIEICKSGAYPMPNLSTTLISYAFLYDYMTQNSLMHQVDVSFRDGSNVNKLQIVNKLSDGSMKYNLIYSAEGGLNDRGIWSYTNGALLSKLNDELDGLSGVHPLALVEFANLKGAFISVAYDAASQNLIACVNSNKLVNFKLNTEIVVDASGYVQTTPNGTWGKKVDNYCSAKVSKQVKNITLSSGLSPIDGNAIKEAMNSIYNQTFKDSYNMVGSSNSYDHRAHPTSLDISLRFSLGDSYSNKMAPIVVDLPVSASFYHSQDGVTYSVTMNTTTGLNKIGLVTNLMN